eukprot:UC1_evm1s51
MITSAPRPVYNPATRNARRLYIGNIPGSTVSEQLAAFFNDQLAAVGFTTSPGEPVLKATTNLEKFYAFIELRSVEETTNCMALDGIVYCGNPLRIGRPREYTPPFVPSIVPPPPPGIVPSKMAAKQPSSSSSSGAPAVGEGGGGGGGGGGGITRYIPNGPNKIYMGNIPSYLNEEQVKDLLQAFGPLKGLHLVRDRLTGTPKGYGFCEFVDPALTDGVIAGLNGFAFGDQSLRVSRANNNNSASNQAAAPPNRRRGPTSTAVCN